MTLIRVRRGFISSWGVDDEWFYPAEETDLIWLVLDQLQDTLRKALIDEELHRKVKK